MPSAGFTARTARVEAGAQGQDALIVGITGAPAGVIDGVHDDRVVLTSGDRGREAAVHADLEGPRALASAEVL